MSELLRSETTSEPATPRPQRTAAAPTDAAAAPRRGWVERYVRRVVLTDLIALVLAVTAADLWRFGLEETTVLSGPFGLSYTGMGACIVAFWWLMLQVLRTRDRRIIGEGPEEYRRVVRASVLVFGWIAIASLLFKWNLARGYLALAFPLGLVLLVLGRKLWRTWLASRRSHGEMTSNVLVIGGIRSAHQITRWFRRHPIAGLRVTGVWVPDRDTDLNEWLDVPDVFIPVMGTDRGLEDALAIAEADVVIVTDTEHLGHKGLKDLAWSLHGTDIELMVSPNVMDVTGPRVHLRAVANMPFLHLEEPQFESAGRLGKTIFDRVFATTVLTVLSPLLLVVAAAVRLTSPGPVLYRSERIGVGGEPFAMLKFRTMVVDADQQVEELLHLNDGAGPLFKLAADPRVTRVGRVLRRYSIDELPQFINVLRGEMSVVGPRPPLRREVEQYDGDASKRLLVRQGITGLWQVSGRSDLDWEETVRLDLDYVENWSMMRDAQIVWRTVKAVFRSDGAY